VPTPSDINSLTLQGPTVVVGECQPKPPPQPPEWPPLELPASHETILFGLKKTLGFPHKGLIKPLFLGGVRLGKGRLSSHETRQVAFVFQVAFPQNYLRSSQVEFFDKDSSLKKNLKLSWMFPKIVVSPNHPFKNRVFHYKPSILGENSIFGNTQFKKPVVPFLGGSVVPSVYGRKSQLQWISLPNISLLSWHK